MEKFLYPPLSVRCINTGPQEFGKTVWLITLILNNLDAFEKLYIYSTTLHQPLFQKIFTRFTKFIPIEIITKNLYEEDVGFRCSNGESRQIQKL